MSNRLACRVAGFGTTIFTAMSALAAQHGAINLGQGFPDFPSPDFVKQAAAASAEEMGDLCSHVRCADYVVVAHVRAREARNLLRTSVPCPKSPGTNCPPRRCSLFEA